VYGGTNNAAFWGYLWMKKVVVERVEILYLEE